MKYAYLASALTALALAISLSACDNKTSATPGTLPATTAPHSGGTIRIAMDSDPFCLDPQQAGSGVALGIGRQLVDSLTDQDPATGAMVPWLAQKWTVSDDARTFTFFLRPNVTFSDGAPLDANAVKANFEAIQALGGKAMLARTYLAGLASVTVINPLAVSFTFKEPNAQFLQATSTMSLGLLSPASLSHTPEQKCQGHISGSGPFVLKNFVQNQGYSLTRRDDYNWPSVLAKHQGPAYLAGVDFKIVPEPGVRFGSLVSGQIDVAVGILAQDEALLKQRDIPMIDRTSPGIAFGLYPNESRPPLNELAVRQAITKGINRSELKNVLSQFQRPADSTLAITTPDRTAQPDLLAYDPKGARKGLEDAGWTLGPDGIYQRNNQRLSVQVDFWQFGPVLELAQQQLRAVGIDLRLNKATPGAIGVKFVDHSYELSYFNLTRADPDVLRVIFGAANQNINVTPDTALQALLENAATATTADKRKALVADVSRRIIEQGHAIPLFDQSIVAGHSKKVHALQFEASTRLQLYDTWLEP